MCILYYGITAWSITSSLNILPRWCVLFVSALFSTRKFDMIIMETDNNQRIMANLYNYRPSHFSKVHIGVILGGIHQEESPHFSLNMFISDPRLLHNYLPVELFTLKYFFYLFNIRPHWNALSPEKYQILNIKTFKLSI